MKYSKDKKVSFDPQWHSYTMVGGKKLMSVTTLISKFKNPFDSDYHSKNAAEKRGITQEQVLKEWKEKGDRSREIGTAIHKIFEDYTENKYSYENGVLCFDCMPVKNEYILEFEQKKQVALDFILTFFITGRLTPVYTEYIVYNDFIAGQIDMVCIDKKGNYFILDFKTNAEISKEAYRKKMLKTLSGIDDCTYFHYCLQLSIYKNLISEHIEKMYIIHIAENYKFIECEYLLDKISLNEIIQSI